jgi:hypothetical protein
MLANAFVGNSKKPTDAELSAALGPSKKLWDQLVSELAGEIGADVQDWSSYSPKAGWSLRVKHKNRTIVWLAPCAACFRVAFTLGDKAMKLARQSRLPERILKVLAEAKRYPEGMAVRLVVRKANDLPAIRELAAVKLAN